MRLLFLGLVLFCAACGGAKPSADVVPTCRLAWTSKGYYAPAFLASRQGWFDTTKVKVEDVVLGMSAGIAAAEALQSGSADVAVMGDTPALICLTKSIPCVLVCAYESSDRMHTIITGPGTAITAPADLSGKCLGVQFGSSTHGGVLLYLAHHGLAPKAVTLVNLPQKDLIEALASRSIDALAASDPTPLLAVDKIAGARELACLSGLGNDYPLVMVATRKFADAHPEAIRAIVTGLRRSVDWINADPAAAAVATAAVTGDSPALEEKLFRRMGWQVRLDDAVFRSLDQTAAFLHRQGKIARLPELRPLSRPELLR